MKKAWEIEYDKFVNAIPKILTKEEQTWNDAIDFEKMQDIVTIMKWDSHVPGSFAPESVIAGAVQSMENMGYDVNEAECLLEKGYEALNKQDIPDLIRITTKMWNLLGALPKIEEHPYWKYEVYDSFEKIERAVCFPKPYGVDTKSKDFHDALFRGWQAQIIGGAFGTALEGYTKENLLKTFGKPDHYVREPNTYNDDITYEIAFLNALSRKGKDVTSEDIALEWVALVPFGWSAEEIALKNIQAGILPPESGFFNNPYREWIGAQMRGAVCGMVAPGDPKEAARLAYLDGVVSHHNNGVLGEIFNAMLVALSFITENAKDILESAIKLIPCDSEYYAILDKAMKSCKRNPGWQEAWEEIGPEFVKYNWVHAYPNAAIEVLAIWYGDGDFDKTIEIIGSLGYDVDCNAAQVMTMIGIINKNIPDKWTKPVGTDIDTYCRKIKKTSIEKLTNQVINCIK